MIALTIVGLAAIGRTPGLNLWPDLVTGMSASSVYTCTLAAGFAAFEANRWSQSNRDRISSGVRSPALVRMHHSLWVILPLLGGFIVALVILSVYARVSGTYGSPSIPWLAALAAALLSAAAAGYSVGTMFGKHWFVPPVAALLFYAAFVVVRASPLDYGIASLFPAVTNTDSVFVRHVDSTMFGQVLFWVGVSVLAIALVGGGWRRGSRRVAAVLLIPVALVASIGVTAVVHTNGQYTTGHNPGDFVCATEEISLCLNRGYAAALEPLYAQFTALNRKVDGTALVAARLEQNVQGTGDEPSPGARSVYIEKLENTQDVAFSVYRYVLAYGGSQRCSESGDSAIAVLYVDSWLSGYFYSLDGLPNPERLSALRALSADAGNAWFRSHSDAYFSCALTLSELP